MDDYKDRKKKKFLNPQVENGHVDIANEIWEAFIVAKFTQHERSIIDLIIRKTWGYCAFNEHGQYYRDENNFYVKKKMDVISYSQIEHFTGIDMRSASKTIKGLVRKNVLLCEERQTRYGKGYAYGIQKRPLDWKVKFRKSLADIYYPSDSHPQVLSDSHPQVLSDEHPHTKDSLSKESLQRNNTCSEQRKNLSSEPYEKDITYDFSTRKFKNIKPEDYERWERKYPGVDIKMALLRMESWLYANPQKDKRPHRLFIDRWLCQEQDNLD